MKPTRPAPPRCSPPQASANSYHVLQYSYVPDILERRDPFRAAHLDGAKKMVCALHRAALRTLPRGGLLDHA